MPRLSMLTSTYNRSEKLKRLYHSLKQSTYKDFEWIIMNDGSSDDTENVVMKMQEESDFPIIYHYQENSGKHVATNRLWQMASGEYCFTIDDDDEMLPDAMERGVAVWDSIPEEERKKYWCVVGRCINAQTRKLVGKPFVDHINELKGRRLKKALSESSECCSFKKTEIMKQYQYPEVKGCSYFPEGNLWQYIDKDYEQYYTNEVFRIYHQVEGESLINYSNSKETYQKRYNMYKFLLSKENTLKSSMFSKRHLTEIYKYCLFAGKLEIGNKEFYEGLTAVNCGILFMTKIPCQLLQRIRKQ